MIPQRLHLGESGRRGNPEDIGQCGAEIGKMSPEVPPRNSTRMEGGVVIADENLRRQIREQFPDCFARRGAGVHPEFDHDPGPGSIVRMSTGFLAEDPGFLRKDIDFPRPAVLSSSSVSEGELDVARDRRPEERTSNAYGRPRQMDQRHILYGQEAKGQHVVCVSLFNSTREVRNIEDGRSS